MPPRRLIRSAIGFKPSTLLTMYHALIQRKIGRGSRRIGRRSAGPKGSSQEVIAAVAEMTQRNPRWVCPLIPQQITLVFGIPTDRMSCDGFWGLGTSRDRTL
jgi:putative transposase